MGYKCVICLDLKGKNPILRFFRYPKNHELLPHWHVKLCRGYSCNKFVCLWKAFYFKLYGKEKLKKMHNQFFLSKPLEKNNNDTNTINSETSFENHNFQISEEIRLFCNTDFQILFQFRASLLTGPTLATQSENFSFEENKNDF